MSELLHCYKYLVDYAPEPSERITPLIRIDVNDRRLAASIVEREFSGSECYAIFIYELIDEARDDHGNSINKTFVDGTMSNVRLIDLIFSTSKHYDEMCGLVEYAVERLYAETTF